MEIRAKYYGDTENRQVFLEETEDADKLHLESQFGIYWVENVGKGISRPVEHHGQDHGDIREGQHGQGKINSLELLELKYVIKEDHKLRPTSDKLGPNRKTKIFVIFQRSFNYIHETMGLPKQGCTLNRFTF